MLIPCFPELLLNVATVGVSCRYCTLAIGRGDGMYTALALVTCGMIG
jgi:hypothetical protein